MTSPLARLWPESRLESSDPLFLVASSGGHLTELCAWAERLHLSSSSTWATFDTPQSHALLAGADVVLMPYVGPRDVRGAMRAQPKMTAALRARPWLRGVVSTGAAIAVPAFFAARRARLPRLYIESIARVTSPSLTGRLVRWTRAADLRAPYPDRLPHPWRYHEGLLDQFTVANQPGSARPRLLVTVGTMRRYRFDALVDSVLATGLADERTTWQLGATTRHDLPGLVVEELAQGELMRLARDSDVVVTHAGAGTIVDLLRIGVCPVVVPRRRARGEHVDDHQSELAWLLRRRGIAHVREADELDVQTIREASATMIAFSDGDSSWCS
jgi:UDP-N-acetylglucosamine--N-acetylmuramyl-(pentapeptide) pyrophosphoryl-undecaprenol N-acetylglucosamine transferase